MIATFTDYQRRGAEDIRLELDGPVFTYDTLFDRGARDIVEIAVYKSGDEVDGSQDGWVLLDPELRGNGPYSDILLTASE
jgi:hypothetical protein